MIQAEQCGENSERSGALSLKPQNRWLAVAAVIVSILCGCVTGAPGPGPAIAQEPNPSASSGPAPQTCTSYADCAKGMICAGAGGGATGTCLWPNQLGQPHPAYDPLPAGYLGSIYGQPIDSGPTTNRRAGFRCGRNLGHEGRQLPSAARRPMALSAGRRRRFCRHLGLHSVTYFAAPPRGRSSKA